MDRRQTVDVVVRLYSLYGRNAPSDAAYAVWHDYLKDIDFATAKRITDDVVMNESDFPSLATWLAHAENYRADKAPAPDEMMREVLGEVRRVGYVGTPQFSHPTIGQAVNTIGWRDICRSEGDWWQHQLRTAYNAIGHRRSVDVRRDIRVGDMRGIGIGDLFAIDEPKDNDEIDHNHKSAGPAAPMPDSLRNLRGRRTKS